MEAKELMAKDWIYDGSINIQVTPENIFDIYTGNWDEPNPIPLTEEIFKANGWKKNGAYNDYILKNETYDFVGYNFDNHHLRKRIDRNRKKPNKNDNFKIQGSSNGDDD